ncbi:hypothetical protein P7K49_013947, partial [Saguinus oedipus]
GTLSNQSEAGTAAHLELCILMKQEKGHPSMRSSVHRQIDAFPVGFLLTIIASSAVETSIQVVLKELRGRHPDKTAKWVCPGIQQPSEPRTSEADSIPDPQQILIHGFIVSEQ